MSRSDRRGVSPLPPQCAHWGTSPTRGEAFCRARRLGAPNFPLQGKIARPKAVTDEVFPSIRPRSLGFVGADLCVRPRAGEDTGPYG